jgi:hypothetical protein
MAEAMRSEGMTYRQVGVELARWEGRSICYTGHAIKRALDRWRRQCEAAEAELMKKRSP